MKKDVMEDKIRNSKCVYDALEVPKELDMHLQQTIENERKRNSMNKNSMDKKWLVKRMGLVAASAAFMFTAGLNISPTFAREMEQNAVLGGISKVLTFRHYEMSDDEKTIQANIPQVDGNTGYTKEVNDIIQQTIAEYEQRASQEIAEYKEAFLATGGTEEEFAAKNIVVDVNYEVKSETEDTVSFVLTGYQTWNSGDYVQEYYNINLKENKKVTLKDILGDGYIDMANDQIKAEIAKDSSGLYFDEEMGGFTSISDDTNFYINQEGNPVIVFQKYEIAAGAAGSPEFEIK